MIPPSDFCGELLDAGLDLFVGVPDSLLKDFCAYVSSDAFPGEHVIAANEGSAVGMACGYHMGSGRAGVVYMQNSGEGNAVNPLLSIADPEVYSIPMLMVIGWRGEPGVRDEPQHAKQGAVTCAILETMGIPYEVIDPRAWKGQLSGLVSTMWTGSRPVAAVVRKGTFGKCPFEPEDNGFPLSREEALEALLGCLRRDELVVSTTGKTSREVFEIRERRSQDHSGDFLTVGGMGHTSSIAYGMSMGTIRNVWCVDGDGSFIMHMGALAAMAADRRANFKYVVNVNGAHESVGGQPTAGQDIDVVAILRAVGFEEVVEAVTPDEIKRGIELLRASGKSALVLRTHQGSRSDLGRPSTPPQENKLALMERISSLREGDAR